MQTRTKTDSNSFESSFSLFRWKTWISATLAAILLNAILFLFLPLLIQPSSPSSDLSQRIDHVQVIRLKTEEPPARKKKEKPPEPPEKKPKPKEEVTSTKPVAFPKLSLPFELNTRLPEISTDIQIPLSETIYFGHSIKGSIGVHELDAPLTPLSRIPPVYPMRARRKGLEGWVRVSFDVDTKGHVNNLTVLEAKPLGIFDKSVIRCVSKWRYKPGTLEGVPITAKMETIVRFEME